MRSPVAGMAFVSGFTPMSPRIWNTRNNMVGEHEGHAGVVLQSCNEHGFGNTATLKTSRAQVEATVSKHAGDMRAHAARSRAAATMACTVAIALCVARTAIAQATDSLPPCEGAPVNQVHVE